MKNFGMSMLWFWVAYAAVTILGIAHTVFNIYVLHMKPMDGTSMGEGYEKQSHGIPSITLFFLVCLAGCTCVGWQILRFMTRSSQVQSGRASALSLMFSDG